MPTQQEFRDWLVRRGNAGAATNYPTAINAISEHYSGEAGTAVDIYSITDQHRISEIAHDYSQAGRFAQFGYEQHGRFRAAIKRYSEFISQHRDQEPDAEAALLPANEPGDSDANVRSAFAYEKDLQTALCAQVAELFPDHRIFGENLLGVEYSIGDRRIDVLLEHRTNGSLLALELKSGRADYRVFGQISMYIGLLQEHFPAKTVSGVIVAGAIDPSLKQACATTNRVTLKLYRMSIELDDA